MTVGAPKGKTVAEPAPTKRDAVPRGAGAPGGFPGALRTPSATENSARAHPHLHHQTGHVGQRGGQAVSFGHRVTVTQELQLGWGEADFTGTTQAHGPVQRPGGMPPALTPSGTPPPSSSKGNEMAETHENKDGGGNQTASDGDAARRARTRDPERGEMQSAQRPGPGRGGGGEGHPSTAPLSLPYHGGRNFLPGSAELGSGTALTPNSETRR